MFLGNIFYIVFASIFFHSENSINAESSENIKNELQNSKCKDPTKCSAGIANQEDRLKFFMKKMPNSGASKSASPSEMITISEHPRIFLLPGFLNDEECERLIYIGNNSGMIDMQVGFDLDTGTRDDTTRTSTGYFLTHKQQIEPLVWKIKEKASRIVKIPIANQEDLQIQHYNKGQQYKAHLDTLMSWPNKRVATFVIYLMDVEEGGETYFPLAQTKDGSNLGSMVLDHKPSLQELTTSATIATLQNTKLFCGPSPKHSTFRAKPRKGDAILFYSLTPRHELDILSLHGSCPVITGEKWVSQIWIDEGIEHPAFSKDIVGFWPLDNDTQDLSPQKYHLHQHGQITSVVANDGQDPIIMAVSLSPGTYLERNFLDMSQIMQSRALTFSCWFRVHSIVKKHTRIFSLSFPSLRKKRSGKVKKAAPWKWEFFFTSSKKMSLFSGSTSSKNIPGEGPQLPINRWILAVMNVKPEFTSRDQRKPLSPTKNRHWQFLTELKVGGGQDFQSVKQIKGKINLAHYDWSQAFLELGDVNSVDTVDVLGTHLLTQAYTGPKIKIFTNTYTPYSQ